jgi:RNA polymerase sigma-70 factor (ECF subfamily)
MMAAAPTTPESFEALVLEHQRLVFRTLTRLTGAGAHVEDLAQEAFLRLFRALAYFRGESTMSTYLYRIVVNVAQDEWKRRRRERTHIAEAPVFDGDKPESDTAWIENFAGDPLSGEHARNPEQRMADAELQQAVENALLALPEMERAVLVLYHQEECSYDGIAAALDLPINTVRTHLHRGRKRLGDLIRLHQSQTTGAHFAHPKTETALAQATEIQSEPSQMERRARSPTRTGAGSQRQESQLPGPAPARVT